MNAAGNELFTATFVVHTYHTHSFKL